MSSTPTAQCPSCGAQFQVTRTELIGRTAPCPSCRRPFNVQPIVPMPTVTNCPPIQPAANQFWTRGQNATASEPNSHEGLVIAVVSIGAVLLLGLIGGAIFVSVSGNGTESAQDESMDDQEVASGIAKESSESQLQTGKPSETRSSQKVDPQSSYSSPRDHGNKQLETTHPDTDYAPSENTDEDYPNYSDQSPINHQSPDSRQDPIPVSRPANTERFQGDVTIRLYRGVALPQTLPMGTGIGFSVNYEFSSGSPRSSSKYFWVISNRQGQVAPVPVPLNRDGSLQVFIGWQKYQAPFTCHMEEVTPQGKRRTISDELTFR